MRVLLINTSERIGGAAVACSRLMEALKNNGVKAKMLVRDKQTDHISVVQLHQNWLTVWRFVWERIVIWMHNRFDRTNLFAMDIANTGANITRLPEFQEADIIHLHWVNQGMLSLANLKQILQSGKPVVWTMHDMWPCTGICHHARQCNRYQEQCNHCPYLSGKGKDKDLAYRTFDRKRRIYAHHPIRFVACSEWLTRQARESALFAGQTVCTIPNPINTSLFRPGPQAEARERCKLPADKKLLLFGSVKITDKRKGIDYLVEACRQLHSQHPEWHDRIGVVVFGKHSDQLAALLPFKVYALNFVTDEKRLVDIYRAVDLYVTPSLEENLPNMIMEAMACGTPCVGFNIGGIPEMIDHLHNGYVARYKNADDFALGIDTLLTHPDPKLLQTQAVRKVTQCYSEQAVAKQYINLYQKITKKYE